MILMYNEPVSHGAIRSLTLTFLSIMLIHCNAEIVSSYSPSASGHSVLWKKIVRMLTLILPVTRGKPYIIPKQKYHKVLCEARSVTNGRVLNITTGFSEVYI